MLSQRWSSVYTWPQTTHLQLAFLTSSLNYAPTDTLSFQSNAYYRGFWQSHVDGNGTDGQPCDPGGALPASSALATATPRSTQLTRSSTLFRPTAFLGEIDRNWTATYSFGGTAQLDEHRTSSSVTTTISSWA